MPSCSPGVEELLVEAGRDGSRASCPPPAARTVIGVPCWSLPETMSTAFPFDAVVAGEDVGRQVGAGDLSEVQGAVGVRPRHADEDLLRHSRPREGNKPQQSYYTTGLRGRRLRRYPPRRAGISLPGDGGAVGRDAHPSGVEPEAVEASPRQPVTPREPRHSLLRADAFLAQPSHLVDNAVRDVFRLRRRRRARDDERELAARLRRSARSASETRPRKTSS